MNATNMVRVQPADVFPRMESSTWEHQTHRVNTETLGELAFIAVTIGMATFLFSLCYYALQNYGML